MKTKLIYLAVLMAAVLITTSCEKEKKNPPLKSYFQVSDGPKYAIKWSATANLNPASGQGYDIALSVGKPLKDIYDESVNPPKFLRTDPVPLPQMTDVFTFHITEEDLNRGPRSLPAGANAYIKYNDQYYSTGSGSIVGGFIEVSRAGTQNQFTIEFQFNLNNGTVITGKHEGKLEVSDNVHLIT